MSKDIAKVFFNLIECELKNKKVQNIVLTDDEVKELLIFQKITMLSILLQML